MSIGADCIQLWRTSLAQAGVTPTGDVAEQTRIRNELQGVRSRYHAAGAGAGSGGTSPAALAQEMVMALSPVLRYYFLNNPVLAQPGRHGARVALAKGLHDSAARHTAHVSKYRMIRNSEDSGGARYSCP